MELSTHHVASRFGIVEAGWTLVFLECEMLKAEKIKIDEKLSMKLFEVRSNSRNALNIVYMQESIDA